MKKMIRSFVVAMALMMSIPTMAYAGNQETVEIEDDFDTETVPEEPEKEPENPEPEPEEPEKEPEETPEEPEKETEPEEKPEETPEPELPEEPEIEVPETPEPDEPIETPTEPEPEPSYTPSYDDDDEDYWDPIVEEYDGPKSPVIVAGEMSQTATENEVFVMKVDNGKVAFSDPMIETMDDPVEELPKTGDTRVDYKMIFLASLIGIFFLVVTEKKEMNRNIEFTKNYQKNKELNEKMKAMQNRVIFSMRHPESKSKNKNGYKQK